MKIIVADDNRSYREALVLYIESELGYDVIFECDNGAALINCAELKNADLILADIEMPELSGIESLKRIQWHYPNLKAIAITQYVENAYLEDFILSGFKGCVFKESVFKELEFAIDKVLKGGLYFPQNISVLKE